MESVGHWEEEAGFLNDLGVVAAVDRSASKTAFWRTPRQALRCAVYRGNACMSDRSLISVARRMGRDFMPGLESALDEAGRM